MIRRIALALTIAAISTSADAQSGGKTDWSNLLKPYEAKTNPNVPIAPVAKPPEPPLRQVFDTEPYKAQISAAVAAAAASRINDVVQIYELIQVIHERGYYCTGNVSAYVDGIHGSYGPTIHVMCPTGDNGWVSYNVSEPVPGRYIVRERR